MSEAARAAREIAEAVVDSARQQSRLSRGLVEMPPANGADVLAPGFAAIIERHMGAGVRTLRDEFAMAALTGMVASPDLFVVDDEAVVLAKDAYEYADAMLAARGTPAAARAVEEGSNV